MAFLPVSPTGVLSSQFSKACAQFQEKTQLYTYLASYPAHREPGYEANTYLATLGATSFTAEFDKVCTQFEEKPAVYLPR